MVESKTPQEYEENWTAFISAYSEQQDLLTYLEQHQLTIKEHFIKAWINGYRYYGVTTTSAIESLHSIQIKRWLVTSTNDLLGVMNMLAVPSFLSHCTNNSIARCSLDHIFSDLDLITSSIQQQCHHFFRIFNRRRKR